MMGSALLAQTKIEGTVIDKDNGDPLINAPLKYLRVLIFTQERSRILMEITV